MTLTSGPRSVGRTLRQEVSAFTVGNDAFAIGGSMRSTVKYSHDEIKGWEKAGGQVEGWSFE